MLLLHVDKEPIVGTSARQLVLPDFKRMC